MTDKTNEEKLIEYIYNESFNDAYNLYKRDEIKPEVLIEILTNVQIDHGTDTVFLSFALVLAQREKTLMANKLVVSLLVNINVDLPGSYFLAYEYHKKVLQENPEDLDQLYFTLFFYDVPDEVVLLPEAKRIARKLREKGIKSDKIDKILDKES